MSQHCEHTMAKRVRILLYLLIAVGAVLHRPALAAEAAAIVTDVRGAARLADGTPIELLRELPAGTEVHLRPASRVVLLHLAAQSTYALSGPGAFAVRARTVDGLADARVTVAKALPPGFRDVRLQPSRITQASIAMRGSPFDQGVRLVSPVATWLLERPSTLRWEKPANVPESDFTVQLADGENRIVFQTTTRATVLSVPDDVRLEPGKLYGWQVTAALAGGKTIEGWAEFGVADDNLRARATSAQPAADASDADRIAFALLLEALDLREAARQQWAEAARGRPDDQRLRALAERR
jgi:hypothetical protein